MRYFLYLCASFAGRVHGHAHLLQARQCIHVSYDAALLAAERSRLAIWLPAAAVTVAPGLAEAARSRRSPR